MSPTLKGIVRIIKNVFSAASENANVTGLIYFNIECAAK